MPKYRQLHTKILDSQDFAEMPDHFTRLFWLLLIVVVDSSGRAVDNPAWLRSRMFPFSDDVSTAEVCDAIRWLANQGMIVRYQVGNRKYFYIPTFGNYQTGLEKEAKSAIPAPPVLSVTPELVESYSGVTPETRRALASASESESVNESDIDLESEIEPETEVIDEPAKAEDWQVADPFDVNKLQAEQLTGVLAIQGDIETLKAWADIPPAEFGDILGAALHWRKTQGLPPIKRLSQIAGSVSTERAKRIQGKNARDSGNGYHKPETEREKLTRILKERKAQEAADETSRRNY